MEVIRTELEGVVVLAPERFSDPRGTFAETYSRNTWREIVGRDVDFVQDNHSISVVRHVMRGLHYQIGPAVQEKLVRVVRGSVIDVAVDLRKSSPTFGQHVAVKLSADNWRQIFIPSGFAHGFLTLEDRTEVIYKVSNYYSPENQRGIRWDDPALGIEWPVRADRVTMSDRDRDFPTLAQANDLF